MKNQAEQIRDMSLEELAAQLGRDPHQGARPVPEAKAIGRNVLLYQWWDQGRLRAASAQVNLDGKVELDPDNIEAMVAKLRKVVKDQVAKDLQFTRMVEQCSGLTISYVDKNGDRHKLWPRQVPEVLTRPMLTIQAMSQGWISKASAREQLLRVGSGA